MIRRLVADPATRAQLIRFIVAGGAVTVLAVAVYWTLATPFGVSPLLANLAGYVAAVVSGYVLHSRWSFRGHGDRDAPAARSVRFVVVSAISLALNSLWVWLLTGPLGGPTWWPILPMLAITPVVTFVLNRKWVFG